MLHDLARRFSVSRLQLNAQKHSPRMPHVASPSPQPEETPLDRLGLVRAQEAVSDFMNWLNGHLAAFQYPSENPDVNQGIKAAESLMNAWASTATTLNTILELNDGEWPLWSKLLPYFMQQKLFVESIRDPNAVTGRVALDPALGYILDLDREADLKGCIEVFLQQCDTFRGLAMIKMCAELRDPPGPKGVQFDSITVQPIVDRGASTTTLKYDLWGSEYSPDMDEPSGFRRLTCRWNPTLRVQHDTGFGGLSQVSMINNALYYEESGELRPMNTWTHRRGARAATRYLLAVSREAWGREYFDGACSTLRPQPLSTASLSQHEAELLSYL